MMDMGHDVRIVYCPRERTEQRAEAVTTEYVESERQADGTWSDPVVRKQTQHHTRTFRLREHLRDWWGIPTQPIWAPNVVDWNQMATQAAAWADLMIYMTIGSSYPRAHHNALAISHGIEWDYPSNTIPASEFADFRQRLAEQVAGLRHIVSCDSNTLNVYSALFAGRMLHRFTRIPNFVDTAAFCPKERKGGPVQIVFPNRTDAHKGTQEFLHAADVVHDMRPDTEFWMVGRANKAESEEGWEKSINQNPDVNQFLHWTWKEPQFMPAVYQNADIIVCPHLGSVGTSLSVLEGMACGKAVITSTAGGNPELVQDGYSGLIVEPTTPALVQALRYLIDRPRERQRLGKAARQVAERAFSLDRWRAKWKAVITQHL